jgi:hypothetical protein
LLNPIKGARKRVPCFLSREKTNNRKLTASEPPWICGFLGGGLPVHSSMLKF